MTNEIKKKYVRWIKCMADNLDGNDLRTLYRCAAGLYRRKIITERIRKK